MPYCPRWPFAHTPSANEKFCTTCGSELVPFACKCGRELSTILRFCPRCGRECEKPWEEVLGGNAKT